MPAHSVNDISDLPRTYDAEALGCHLWMARWADCGLHMTGPVSGEIIDPSGELERECLDGAVVDVVDGHGVGQFRRTTLEDPSSATALFHNQFVPAPQLG